MHTAESGIRIFSFRIRQSEAQAAQKTYVQRKQRNMPPKQSGIEICRHLKHCRNAAKQDSEAQAAQLTYVQSTYGAGNLRKSGNETCMHIQYCRNAAKQVK